MIAEVTAPSHGVGWELCYAQAVRQIPILCLAQEEIDVSAMIGGNQYITLHKYKTAGEARKIIDDYMEQLQIDENVVVKHLEHCLPHYITRFPTETE